MKKVLLFSIFLIAQNLNCLDNMTLPPYVYPPVIEMVEDNAPPADPKIQVNKLIVRLKKESKKPNLYFILTGIILTAGGISFGGSSGFDELAEQCSAVSLVCLGLYLIKHGVQNIPVRDKLDNALREKAFLEAQTELESLV